jgi:hypothetical protein
MDKPITKLTFLGTDSHVGDSPTLYRTDRGTLAVQGWKITEVGVRAQARNLPDHEDIVEIPIALLRFAPKAADA